jgi:type IV pilus assembly protein PilY1
MCSIIWDSSANWGANIPVPNCSFSDGSGGPKASSPNKEQGTKFAIEKCAIYNVIYALPLNPDGTARFNVGLMLFNESNAPQGGYPRKQFLPLTAANKTLLLNTIRNIAINDDKANNGPYAQAMQEAYLMFARMTPTAVRWAGSGSCGGGRGKCVGAPGNGCGKTTSSGWQRGSRAKQHRLGQSAEGRRRHDFARVIDPYITNSDQIRLGHEFARFMRAASVARWRACSHDARSPSSARRATTSIPTTFTRSQRRAAGSTTRRRTSISSSLRSSTS